MDARVERLDELQARLEHLVNVLGGSEVPAADEMDRAWSAASRAFEAFRRAAEPFAGQETPDEVRKRVEAVLRLDAVAVGLASRHRDALAGELDKLAGVRSRLRALDATRGSAGVGDACDVAG